MDKIKESEERGKEDARVIQSVLSGDKESFRFLVLRYQQFAVNLAYGMVYDYDLANEIAQESMVKAFENLSKLQDATKFHSWLYGIIKNTSLMVFKRRRTKGTISLELISDNLIDEKMQAADVKIIEEQRKAAVWKAIGELGDKYKEVIILFHFYSKSYEEIGALLGLEQKGVDSRLHRARQMLREKLKNLINE